MEVKYTCTICEFQEAGIIGHMAIAHPPALWIVVYDSNLNYYPICSFHCLIQLARSGERHYYYSDRQRITSRRRVNRQERRKNGIATVSNC